MEAEGGGGGEQAPNSVARKREAESWILAILSDNVLLLIGWFW